MSINCNLVLEFGNINTVCDTSSKYDLHYL